MAQERDQRKEQNQENAPLSPDIVQGGHEPDPLDPPPERCLLRKLPKWVSVLVRVDCGHEPDPLDPPPEKCLLSKISPRLGVYCGHQPDEPDDPSTTT